MMRKVFEFKIPVLDAFVIEMPRGARLLHVALQNMPESEVACLWALCDPFKPAEPRHFRLAGTGHEIHDDNLIYVGTVHPRQGRLVFHLFEVTA